MRRHIFAALAAVALVSGCASTTPEVEEEEEVVVSAVEVEEVEPQEEEAFVQEAKDRVFFGFDKSNLTADAVAE